MILPPVSACVANPTAPGCAVVLPPIQTAAKDPITQTTNTVVNLVNGSTGGGSTSTNGNANNKDEKKDDKKDALTSNKSEAKNEPPPPKTFCN